jgi:D-glycero-D-manno-heptose 1,7-bisphosphate phosphatase
MPIAKSSSNASPAVFLDRDGVLIEDADLVTRTQDVRLLPGVPHSVRSLKAEGYQLIVVSNQTVVARGLATEAEVQAVNSYLNRLLEEAAESRLDAFYFCPHHPKATLVQYRVACDCRKPRAGMLLQAAREWSLDLTASFMVGDRITDIIAGARAGCRTVLVQTGRHLAPPIETVETVDLSVKPNHVCADLAGATEWILEAK